MDVVQVLLAAFAGIFALVVLGGGAALGRQALLLPGTPRPEPCMLCGRPVEPDTRCSGCGWGPDVVAVVGRGFVDGYQTAVRARKDFEQADRIRGLSAQAGEGGVPELLEEADRAEMRANDSVQLLLTDFAHLVDVGESGEDLRRAAEILEASLAGLLRAAAAERRGGRAGT